MHHLVATCGKSINQRALSKLLFLPTPIQNFDVRAALKLTEEELVQSRFFEPSLLKILPLLHL